ncbi:hypothetical protein DIU31_003075 [Mucilaginibacter rubeus]|uniref:Uncharacterized protein n=1 Tax=Mucilaginibacter rubeus TaxID=2027860 RepID=A0AAE6JBD9_9SPHI|nr:MULTISPECIES: hypothetical protein [Mucilaginibacter]QEM02549.1 hypothetical protein DIU31_003075 [Mucilaginibacter rubeus]QEM15169.1 hypothetical protein DIU38_003105 [Mucilaginibacter gossypii]QTE42107.1 hypothetical protein J3L19_24695 [Mucilaginibacter rubeus]QTE48708.1 hypothetical protein J3L21_24670 [Mucilaginibacter rubeus]QTE53806.1 hypothetical protein J3L23_16300 [Mucilaginibacter rubeus]
MRLNESFGGVLREKAPKSFDLRAFEAILLCFCTQSGNGTLVLIALKSIFYDDAFFLLNGSLTINKTGFTNSLIKIKIILKNKKVDTVFAYYLSNIIVS